VWHNRKDYNSENKGANMIIVISSQGNDLQSKPSLRFGRAPIFIIYNLETNAWEAIDNQAVSQSGGAGVAASQTLIDKKATVALSGSFGPNAQRALTSAGIKMLSFDDSFNTIQDVIEGYKNDALNEVSSRGTF
jgi:predicted Fe-Mo cluster-binding NifX family protein